MFKNRHKVLYKLVYFILDLCRLMFRNSHRISYELVYFTSSFYFIAGLPRIQVQPISSLPGPILQATVHRPEQANSYSLLVLFCT